LGDFFPVLTAPSFTVDVIVYGLLVLGVFGFLWAYYDRRDRSYFDIRRRRISFHCIRCNHLYTEMAGTVTAPCPRCGHKNVRLKF
jgi:DNA-directed RNA polymerase subunit RPC12/RpoP